MIAAIVALWAVMAWLADPSGAFPLADDWSYARTVVDLLQGRGYALHPFTPTIAFSHIVLGTAVSALFGFDFEILHITMYVVGLVGVCATYVLARLLGASLVAAAVVALTVATSPIYFLLSGTFMTDVSFYAMAMIALCGLAAAVQSGSRAAYRIGTVAACVALLNRQIGLAIPLGFAVVEVLLDRPVRLRRALAPLLAGIACLALWQLLVPVAGGPSLVANSKLVEAADFLSGSFGEIATRIASNAVVWTVYAGLLCLPFVVLARGAVGVTRRRIVVTSTTLGVLWIVLVGRLMPALPPVGSWLTPNGVGPLTLRDTMILRLPNVPTLPWIARLGLTAVSLWSAGWLLTLAWETARRFVAAPRGPQGRAVAMLGIVGATWMAPSLASFFFDRYLLPFVGVVLAALSVLLSSSATLRSSVAMRLVAAALLAQVVVSTAGAHDYFAWNRARLQALESLLHDQQVGIASIDAGFEWSGWYLFSATRQPVAEKSWWWVIEDDWVLSFGPIPGYAEVGRVPFRSWLSPLGEGFVLMLRRTAPD